MGFFTLKSMEFVLNVDAQLWIRYNNRTTTNLPPETTKKKIMKPFYTIWQSDFSVLQVAENEVCLRMTVGIILKAV